MPAKTSTLIIIALFTVSLFSTAIMQMHIKSNPRIIMLAFGVLTLIFLLGKQKFIASILFYILAGTMIFITCFLLTDWLIGIINPDRGWAVSGAERHRTMDMSWIWSMLISLVFTPLTLHFYHKKKNNNRAMEIAVTVVFIIITAIIYVKREI